MSGMSRFALLTPALPLLADPVAPRHLDFAAADGEHRWWHGSCSRVVG
jgi:hypothetical protein